ncbi:RICIN domain-containing protein [Kitasatospora sp. NPDC058218]|uniref:RICIN domain-containing protein n=1 Tax=Kitasatospora sp. NPDC058218 TaxID=3346385 RepID=UPI0036DBADB6
MLNVVAHHDDDLLFLAPDLINDLRNPDVCVRTVFLVGSYYDRWGLHPTDDAKFAYMENRERGVREAYQGAAGIVGSWGHGGYAQAGVQAALWSLGGRVSTVELRVPDASASNSAGTMRRGQLWALYADNLEAWPLPGDDAPVQQRLSREQVLAFVQGVIDDYQPTVINTVDPSADQHTADWDGKFHSDHVAAARLLAGALHRRGGTWPRVTFYRDYLARTSPENLDDAAYRSKRDALDIYARRDDEICSSADDCHSEESEYAPWLRVQYYADYEWGGGYHLPVPWSGGDPEMNQSYHLVNRATGLYLDIPGSSTDDWAAPTTWTNTGNANQVFVLKATLGGWNLRPRHSGKCLDVPGASTATTGLIQYSCTANTADPAGVGDMVRLNEAFRIRGDHGRGFSITLAHSGMALTASGGAGSAVVQAPNTGAANQVWDLVRA